VDLFALATLPTGADEAGEPPSKLLRELGQPPSDRPRPPNPWRTECTGTPRKVRRAGPPPGRPWPRAGRPDRQRREHQLGRIIRAEASAVVHVASRAREPRACTSSRAQTPPCGGPATDARHPALLRSCQERCPVESATGISSSGARHRKQRRPPCKSSAARLENIRLPQSLHRSSRSGVRISLEWQEVALQRGDDRSQHDPAPKVFASRSTRECGALRLAARVAHGRARLALRDPC
jgi:hypothetical protein